MLVDAVHSAAHFPLNRRSTPTSSSARPEFYGPHIGLPYCRPDCWELHTDKLVVQDDAAPTASRPGP
jgi:hypothetical protein